MPYFDLARDTANLVAVAHSSRSRSLNELAGLAARQVPSYAGAAATLWVREEPIVTAASHPDVSDLVDVELDSRRGPEMAAIASGAAARCPDTLREERWPEYAREALLRGVRSSVTLAHRSGSAAVTLSLFGARPQTHEQDQFPVAELLIAVGSAVLGNAAEFRQTQRTAIQMQDAAAVGSLIEQAKGMLMQSLGCGEDDALARMRQVSQRHSLRMAEVARRIVTSRTAREG